jgi:hypothetical protein
VSGQRLEGYFHDHVFGPPGMADRGTGELVFGRCSSLVSQPFAASDFNGSGAVAIHALHNAVAKVGLSFGPLGRFLLAAVVAATTPAPHFSHVAAGLLPDPVIACAEIPKGDLFFVSTSRKESEVILDPSSIKRPHLESAS